MKDVVLVTGARGFVGRQVIKTLRASGQDVVALAQHWNTSDELDGLLPSGVVDRCVHLAWYAQPQDYLTNLTGNLRALESSLALLEVLNSRGCRHLTVAGSSAEYAPVDHALREDDPVGPWSVYGASKDALGHLLRSPLRPKEMAVAWARLFNVSGPGEHPERLFPWVARSIARGQRVALSPGRQVRDYLDVRDVATALQRISAVGFDGAVNVSGGTGTELRVLLLRLARQLSGEELLGFGERASGPHEVSYVVGDNQRLRALGWEPSIDHESMLGAVVREHALV